MKLFLGITAVIITAALIFDLPSPAPARAQAQPPLTVAQALSLLAGLRNLDGHMIVAKQNGVEGTLMVPWDFGSGTLRLKIASNIALLAADERAAEESRKAVVAEILKDMPADKDGRPATSILSGTPEAEAYLRQYGEILKSRAPSSDRLLRIKQSELKLDRNEIPVTALSALAPILDADVLPAK